MRAQLLAAAAAALLAAASPIVPPPPAACAAITAPSPCGQLSDSPARCASKGCCYDAHATYPCFYPGGDAVPITNVHVVQASHFDAGFAFVLAARKQAMCAHYDRLTTPHPPP